VRILAVTGSSGGHIFPALGFLDTLTTRRKDIEVLLVLPRKGIISQIKGARYNINYISIASIKPRLDFKNFIALLNFLKGSCESIIILLKFRPCAVVGFGSLASIPMVIFAWLLGMKTLIHEQNVIPGRANRLLVKFVDKIALSFAETQAYLKDYKRKIAVTGNPIRAGLIRVDKNKALDFFNLNSGKFTILVTGGSQASHRINFGFLRAMSAIPDKSIFQVIHLAGNSDIDLLDNAYRDLNIDARLFNFLEPMHYAYSASDLVVSRGGATTIAEIMFFKMPAIIVPYPYAYKHQAANAGVLKNTGAGITIRDDELDADILGKNINELISNPQRIRAMRSCYGNGPGTGANDLLAEAVVSL